MFEYTYIILNILIVANDEAIERQNKYILNIVRFILLLYSYKDLRKIDGVNIS